jgi:hypothetical protein
MIYVALGIAAAAGGYWYYAHPEDVSATKNKAKADEEEMIRKGRQSVDAAKAHADDAYQRGQATYDETKVCLTWLSVINRITQLSGYGTG